MKQTKTLAAITIAVSMSAFLFSCGGNNEKTVTSDTTATTTIQSPPAPVAKQEKILIVEHKVSNFSKWKKEFDANDSTQKTYGLNNYVLGRGMDDSNMVVIFMKMDDVNKAKEFGSSADLKTKMQKAGVMGKPVMNYIDVVMNDTSTIPQTARVRVTHKVKDWDAWKKVFDEDKQARMDAGLIDRGLGYDDSDNHVVSMVFAITDMNKAKAFMHSKELKEKMEKGGVEGEPAFLFYNIVQMY